MGLFDDIATCVAADMHEKNKHDKKHGEKDGSKKKKHGERKERGRTRHRERGRDSGPQSGDDTDDTDNEKRVTWTADTVSPTGGRPSRLHRHRRHKKDGHGSSAARKRSRSRSRSLIRKRQAEEEAREELEKQQQASLVPVPPPEAAGAAADRRPDGPATGAAATSRPESSTHTMRAGLVGGDDSPPSRRTAVTAGTAWPSPADVSQSNATRNQTRTHTADRSEPPPPPTRTVAAAPAPADRRESRASAAVTAWPACPDAYPLGSNRLPQRPPPRANAATPGAGRFGSLQQALQARDRATGDNVDANGYDLDTRNAGTRRWLDQMPGDPANLTMRPASTILEGGGRDDDLSSLGPEDAVA